MTISKEQQQAIAQQWRSRAKAQGLKPGTKTHDTARMHFVAGAMSALHNTDIDATSDRLSTLVPPNWVVAGIAGRDPFEGV